MKFIAPVLLAALLGGYVSIADAAETAPPKVSPENSDALRSIWQGCLAAAVRELDDHISTASDIATGVQHRCRDEYDALTRSFNFPPEIRRQADEDRINRTKQLAVSLVLQTRAADRAKANKK